MTQRKHTKAALFASVTATLLCTTMFVGTTLAWFTDTAQTDVRDIYSGVLGVELVDQAGVPLHDQFLSFQTTDDSVLWEPGSVWTLQDVYVRNCGSLALKYRFVITGIRGDAQLNEVIDWDIKLGETDVLLHEGTSQEFHLSPGEVSEALTITGTMQSNADISYQGLKIDGISVGIEAAQDTVEFDSSSNTYDQDAQYGADNGTTDNGTDNDTDSGTEQIPVPVIISGLEPGNYALVRRVSGTTLSESSFSAPDVSVEATEGGCSTDLVPGSYALSDNSGNYFIFEVSDSQSAPISVRKAIFLSDQTDLEQFRDAVNDGERYADTTVCLAADIDLHGEPWAPIGGIFNFFAGSFDGQGHTISNLNIDQNTKHYQGLFGYGKLTELKNLTIHNAHVSASSCGAAFIGANNEDLVISNVRLTGDVKITVAQKVGAGIVGTTLTGTETVPSLSIRDVTIHADPGSYVKCTVTTNSDMEYIGGVWGRCFPADATNISSNLDVYSYSCANGGIGGGCAEISDRVTCSGSVTVAYRDTETHKGTLQCWQTNGTIYGFGVGSSNHASHTDCSSSGILTIAGQTVTDLMLATGTNGYQNNDVRFGAPYYTSGVITS